jgi:hypothetical protein
MLMSFVDGAQSREAQNEKIKLIANTLQNFGVAVTVALFGKLFTAGFSGVVVIAAIVAIMLFMTAYHVLSLLEGDEL